ncbi:sarcosine oxidase subunit alpha family protein [Jiella sp. MQZ9-1]|uniref:Sarcosine oxidase subunit alpha family protein n=1 Tax=Jiella flava TaxID=2816857 RepID=A0A939G1S8_9HYPH|nr:sarcosine oxidase subunit alpha family protein [Jiella flava]MBO0664226.1 sarcosine oxidase subunit alpha family protein [Jiella flava]MCD2472872.1 sarcosine oxidase subunit alpha family protein [Jiella flava]
MSQPFRRASGGRIDRNRPLTVSFNGKTLEGFAGDTVASMLLASGQHLAGRSFKYHRPRGILSHGSDEPSALLSVDWRHDRGPGYRDPNNRASVVEARDGLVVKTQNHWPSLALDIGAVNDLLSPIFVAGFYYKTFMWPKRFWDKVYEPIIRKAAGLGEAPEYPDPDHYANRHAHADVLIVGAGPAGLAAALTASADASKRVILADEGAEPGGALLNDLTSTIDGQPAMDWVEDAVATLDGRENVILLPRTTGFGYYNHNHVCLVERVSDHRADAPEGLARERLWQVRARQVVLATGSHERPLVFENNDKPGVMLAESLRAYVNRWAVLPGDALIVVTAAASAYRTALDAKAAGMRVEIVDIRLGADCGPELAAARDAGITVRTGHTVIRALGGNRVGALVVAPIGTDGSIGPKLTLDCDCVAMSGGWTPSVHLFSQSRGKLAFDTEIDAFVPDKSVQAERSAGACRGLYDLGAVLADGFAAGSDAIGGAASPQPVEASAAFTGFQPVRVLPSDADPSRIKAFVDFQNDVTVKDIKLAVREGFESIEHVKRYTTTGMATDQGKTSNMNALGLVAGILNRPIPAVGTTTFRPPYTPVSFGALIGPARNELFDPVRKTPIDGWAAQNGAVFEPVGLWRRARYFPQAGEDMQAALARETKAVRSTVGIFDASTLGKIEVVGPDAAEFMNRIYTNAWNKLKTGGCRYGLMLREDGFVYDDGVVARLAENRFHVTTTTGGAPRVLRHMEDYLQTEWPDLDVFLTSITEQWAVIALQGPKARDVLEPFVSEIELSETAFPHMTVKTGSVCGVPCRLFRVSFTGELGYEVNVPADYGEAVWTTLFNAGQKHGITPYGTEAMHVLRAEVGYIVVGQETDGTATPDDVGLSGLVSKVKPDFVGKRSLSRPDMVAAGRRQLVGLLTKDPNEVLDEGAQVVKDPGQPIPMKMIGHVTSSYRSENCGRSIAMAMIDDGRARIGETVFATTPTGFTEAVIAPAVFYEVKGETADA